MAVLPIRAASVGAEGLVLGRRSRLLLRLPEVRVPDALVLCGRSLDLAGTCVEIGAAKTRPLAPHPTLYAHRVAARSNDEAMFMEDARQDLVRLGVRTDFVVGRRSVTRGPAGELSGYSLMLADLSPRESLTLQTAGLGAHRRLGFGVFVGHK
jgi:CRISPR-associated protein Cas6